MARISKADHVAGRAGDLTVSAHTPGPWVIVELSRRESVGGLVVAVETRAPDRGYRCIVGRVNREDATLIAAAPDLLALVEEELAELEGASCVDLDDPDEPLSARASKLRAVIAKARGGK